MASYYTPPSAPPPPHHSGPPPSYFESARQFTPQQSINSSYGTNANNYSSMGTFSHMSTAPGGGMMSSSAGFAPGTAASAAAANVELSIWASDLRDMDVFSKSDPMCVVYIKPFGSGRWQEVKRTEPIMNSLNPHFTTKVKLTYLFEEAQHLRFEIYDIDSRSNNLQDHDFIGSAQCTLAQIVTATAAGCHSMRLENAAEGRPSGNGNLHVSAEELSSCKDDLELQFLGKKLDRKDFFGSSDPFLQFSRSTETGKYTVVHRTEVIKNSLNPTWKKFNVPIRTLCNGDEDRNIRVECFDHNQSGDHSLIGEFYVTVRQLKMGPSDRNVYECINPKKRQKKKNYKNSGLVHLIHTQTIKGYSFLDYVRGGTELACTISIDFTQSNGTPNDPRSLHYMYGQTANQYEMAIQSVGEIIEDYDSDKLFPVLGFGARLPPEGRVSHCFFVNGHQSNPYCERIPGVLSAYKACLSRIQLYGPTNFAPTIEHVSNFARQHRDGSQYFILLIVTDGIITDMPQTREAIVEASALPLSIIIVGVGMADFSAMEELDGDAVRLTDPHGREAVRDIVQFVPFRDFLQGSRSQNPQMARLHLAKEVLAEVPEQFVSYMKANRIVPGRAGGRGTNIPDPEQVTGGVF